MTNQLSVPAAILAFQGLVNVGFGTYGLVRPADLIASLSEKFGGQLPLPAAHASSCQLISMGLLTFFTVQRPSLHRQALVARIFVHVLAGYLFWGDGATMRSGACTEFSFAAMNVIGLFLVKDGSER